MNIQLQNKTSSMPIYSKFQGLETSHLKQKVTVPAWVIHVANELGSELVKNINSAMIASIGSTVAARVMPGRIAEYIDLKLEQVYFGNSSRKVVVLPEEFFVCSETIKIAYHQALAGVFSVDSLLHAVKNSILIVYLVGKTGREVVGQK